VDWRTEGFEALVHCARDTSPRGPEIVHVFDQLVRTIPALQRPVGLLTEGDESPLTITPTVVVSMLGAPTFMDEEIEDGWLVLFLIDLAGAMHELGRKGPDESVFLESWITNSDKVFATFRP